ncbi:hypothetical protein VSDG_09249 [Cytospora chrysosperma]|uniref:Uncharacterized protein n=1 Tax=Cytospora chrysosperma TaxID=252740 RepID=A0A423VBY2_CYTCH|nr:hypothetical protein VSDG_09249 [Valsa sordida]
MDHDQSLPLHGRIVPHAQQIVLHTAHWRTNGIGALQLLDTFKALASSADPDTLPQAEEPAYLTLSIEEVLDPLTRTPYAQVPGRHGRHDRHDRLPRHQGILPTPSACPTRVTEVLTADAKTEEEQERGKMVPERIQLAAFALLSIPNEEY